MSPQQVTWIARALGLVMLVLAVFSVYIVSTCYESPVDLNKLECLYEGAPKDEVRAILGDPAAIEDGGRRWLYSKSMKVRVVQIIFDEDDLLISRGFTDSDSSMPFGDGSDRGREIPIPSESEPITETPLDPVQE